MLKSENLLSIPAALGLYFKFLLSGAKSYRHTLTDALTYTITHSVQLERPYGDSVLGLGVDEQQTNAQPNKRANVTLLRDHTGCT